MVSPEAHIVLLSAAGPQQEAALRRCLEQPLDWSRLLAISIHQKATLAVRQRVCELAPDLVPAETAEALRRNSQVTSFRQLHLLARLKSAVATLQDAGIRVLLLKGAALALTVYRSFEDRPMGDIDLLVDAADAQKAQRLLMQAGWKPYGDHSDDELYEVHHHLPPLIDANGSGFGLELHTGLFLQGHPFELPTGALWQQARSIELDGRSVAVLSRTHTLLHLCIHFAWSHMARQGAWRAFRDLHAIRAAEEVDWNSLCRAAHHARAATSCYWTLRLARDLTGFEIPGPVLQDLAPPTSSRVLDLLARHLASGVVPMEHACPSVQLSKRMWEAAIRPRWSGHGRLRPWQHSDDFTDSAHLGEPDRGVGKLRVHLRQLSQWRRYASAIFSPSQALPAIRR